MWACEPRNFTDQLSLQQALFLINYNTAMLTFTFLPPKRLDYENPADDHPVQIPHDTL